MPQLEIEGGLTRKTTRGVPLIITSQVKFTLCGSPAVVGTFYRWTAVPSGALPSSVVLNRRDLFVPSNALVAGTSFTLMLEALPTRLEFSATRATITVDVQMEPLVAVVQPSGWVDVGESSTTILYGNRSSDPSDVPQPSKNMSLLRNQSRSIVPDN